MTDTQPTPAPVLFKKRGPKSTNIRKRPATPPPDSNSSSDYSESEDEAGRIIKRRKTTGISAASASTKPRDDADPNAHKPTQYTASHATTLTKSEDATKQSAWFSTDAHGRAPNPLRADAQQPGKSIGPQKAPANVRTITVTDFAPDVCKDYKQTGFCGFGDSCKFLHMREDYKQGWQLDKDWEKAGGSNKSNNKAGSGRTVASATTRRRMADGGEVDLEDEGLEEILKDIPFACVICKQEYKTPIVTLCGHYFCESCALKRYKKNPGCAICGDGTSGVFNSARNLKRLLEKKKERAKKVKEAKKAAGEPVSDDEDEAAR